MHKVVWILLKTLGLLDSPSCHRCHDRISMKSETVHGVLALHLLIKTRAGKCPWSGIVPSKAICVIYTVRIIFIGMVILDLTLRWTLFDRQALSLQPKHSAQFVQTSFDVWVTILLDKTGLCRSGLGWPLAFFFPSLDQTSGHIREIDGDRGGATLKHNLSVNIRVTVGRDATSNGIVGKKWLCHGDLQVCVRNCFGKRRRCVRGSRRRGSLRRLQLRRYRFCCRRNLDCDSSRLRPSPGISLSAPMGKANVLFHLVIESLLSALASSLLAGLKICTNRVGRIKGRWGIVIVIVRG